MNDTSRRIRTSTIAGIAAAGILVSGGTGAGLAAIAFTSVSSAASASSETRTSDGGTSAQLPSTTTPDTDSGDTGSGDSGTQQFPGYGFGPGTGTQGGGTDGGTGTTAESTEATDDQSAGVVLIETQLGYLDGAAAGTGIVLTSDGEILTNNHVVEGSTTITVTIATTGEQYTAEVVGTDSTNDIAVLQLEDASGLTVADLDTSGDLALGDEVTGVGNANGQGYLSAADGQVTALEQEITVADELTGAGKQLDGLIETDAAIVSGDSGGPLIDADGEVVGIDTAASSDTSDPTGYAIPIEDALEIVEQIESGTESGTVSIGLPAFLGVTLSSTQSTTGATIGGALEGTPAADAGLTAGDTITAVDSTPISSGDQLSTVIAGYEPGDQVTITWTDGTGDTLSATVTLIEGPAE